MREGLKHICICGHKDNRHADIGVFTGWGHGPCELCKCSRFECSTC